MRIYPRTIRKSVENDFFRGRAIILVGPRRTGKTTLCETILNSFREKGRKILSLNGDSPTDRDILNEKDLTQLSGIIGDSDILFVDEGQKIPSIGQTIKLLVDAYGSKKQILVTGSSSFNLLNMASETLTGRKFVYHLYPLSVGEIFSENVLEARKSIDAFLTYGMYPNVVAQLSFEEKRRVVSELAESALYKDILEFQSVKNPAMLRNLLKALALQVGSEVSYRELSQLLGIDQATVERYVDLLEKNFVLFRLNPFFSNKRKEISKSKKIYFYDNGVRNALIGNFDPLFSRVDIGALWESAMIAERIKYHSNIGRDIEYRFWRTYAQSEIDWVEESGGMVSAFEFKWNPNKVARVPKPFAKAYPSASFETVTPKNFEPFVGL